MSASERSRAAFVSAPHALVDQPGILRPEFQSSDGSSVSGKTNLDLEPQTMYFRLRGNFPSERALAVKKLGYFRPHRSLFRFPDRRPHSLTKPKPSPSSQRNVHGLSIPLSLIALSRTHWTFARVCAARTWNSTGYLSPRPSTLAQNLDFENPNRRCSRSPHKSITSSASSGGDCRPGEKCKHVDNRAHTRQLRCLQRYRTNLFGLLVDRLRLHNHDLFCVQGVQETNHPACFLRFLWQSDEQCGYSHGSSICWSTELRRVPVPGIFNSNVRGIVDPRGSSHCPTSAHWLTSWIRFLQADAYWTLAMALNVYLTFYRKFDAAKLRRMEIPYLLVCYGAPFVVAITYVFISTPKNGRMYGNALLWCWVSSGWDIWRIATFYGPVW